MFGPAVVELQGQSCGLCLSGVIVLMKFRHLHLGSAQVHYRELSRWIGRPLAVVMTDDS